MQSASTHSSASATASRAGASRSTAPATSTRTVATTSCWAVTATRTFSTASDYSPVAIQKLERPTELGYYIWLWRIGETPSLANAGDVNRDGLLDFVIGTIRTNNSRGRAYVIFGQRDTDEIDVTTDRLDRYRIRGLYSRSYTGAVVDGGGDVNGDGIPDQLVTAPAIEFGVPGDAFVVFGKTDARAVRLTNPRHHALQIPGLESGDNLGSGGDLVGDVNGDGLGDVALLASADYPREGPGRVHVVYGHRTRLVADLDDPSTGFRIVAACDPSEPCAINYIEDAMGVADFDGDGLRDIAVVGRFATSDRYADEGKVFVVGSSVWTD
ncbi:MAG TPA: integrin alpha [Actinomycetota bacterium]|jgi:hypothetical protein